MPWLSADKTHEMYCWLWALCEGDFFFHLIVAKTLKPGKLGWLHITCSRIILKPYVFNIILAATFVLSRAITLEYQQQKFWSKAAPFTSKVFDNPLAKSPFPKFNLYFYRYRDICSISRSDWVYERYFLAILRWWVILAGINGFCSMAGEALGEKLLTSHPLKKRFWTNGI